MVKREQVREVMLAISLLDHLVINCGYPIHLLVSKRDFMNAFVYRFPPNSKVNYNFHSSIHWIVDIS